MAVWGAEEEEGEGGGGGDGGLGGRVVGWRAVGRHDLDWRTVCQGGMAFVLVKGLLV